MYVCKNESPKCMYAHNFNTTERNLIILFLKYSFRFRDYSNNCRKTPKNSPFLFLIQTNECLFVSNAKRTAEPILMEF